MSDYKSNIDKDYAILKQKTEYQRKLKNLRKQLRKTSFFDFSEKKSIKERIEQLEKEKNEFEFNNPVGSFADRLEELVGELSKPENKEFKESTDDFLKHAASEIFKNVTHDFRKKRAKQEAELSKLKANGPKSSVAVFCRNL